MNYIKKKNVLFMIEVPLFHPYSMVWKLIYIPVTNLYQSTLIVEWLGSSTVSSLEIGS